MNDNLDEVGGVEYDPNFSEVENHAHYHHMANPGSFTPIDIINVPKVFFGEPKLLIRFTECPICGYHKEEDNGS